MAVTTSPRADHYDNLSYAAAAATFSFLSILLITGWRGTSLWFITLAAAYATHSSIWAATIAGLSTIWITPTSVDPGAGTAAQHPDHLPDHLAGTPSAGKRQITHHLKSDRQSLPSLCSTWFLLRQIVVFGQTAGIDRISRVLPEIFLYGWQWPSWDDPGGTVLPEHSS
ncbi:MAG: hypothetical protein P0107_06990 [Nitrosomonas sp.]|nr:hypothetical protein [Nitrosomonas sp.]